MRGQRYAPMLGLRLCAVVAVLAVVASSAEGARSALCLSQRGASAPSGRRVMSVETYFCSCVCAMTWRFHAIDAAYIWG